MRRWLFEALNGFNEAWDGGEDAEFSWRAQLAGHELHFASEAVVAYRYRATPAEVFRRSFRAARNEARLVREFKAFGCPRPSSRRALRRLVTTVLGLPRVVMGEESKGRWARTAGIALGRIAGSYRWGVFAP